MTGRRSAVLGAVVVLSVVGLTSAGLLGRMSSAEATQPHAARSWSVPPQSDELMVVTSPTYDPPDYLASFRTFERANPFSPWEPVFPEWQAETGYGHLLDVRHEGDGATPTGTFPIGPVMYGNAPDPGGLSDAYHHLVCGDWWDEDPYTAQYNQFVHVACGSTPDFASWSEALWTETEAYPYFAVLGFNMDPVVSGSSAPGSGIFLHNWVGGPTAGCVALPRADLLAVLRWLRPSLHPVIAIGTDAEVGAVPPPAPEARWSVAPLGGASYWLASSGGSVVPFGRAQRLGSPDPGLPAAPEAAPVVDVASLPARAGRGQGYWTVTASGSVAAFGAARPYGSVSTTDLARARSPVVGLAATPDGDGYWVVTSSGRVFPFGDARVGAGRPLPGVVVAIAAAPNSRPDRPGYYLVSRGGGVGSYGAAPFFGSPRFEHRALSAVPVGLLPTADGGGYWMALADGGVLRFGDASFLGSAVHDARPGPVVGISADSGGYALYAVPPMWVAHPHQYQFPGRS